MMEKGPDGHLMTPCRPHKRQCYEISEGEEIEEKVERKSLESKLVDKPKAATDAVKAPLAITSALLDVIPEMPLCRSRKVFAYDLQQKLWLLHCRRQPTT